MNIHTLSQCPPMLKNFLGYLQNIKGKSEKTVSEYFFDIRTFLRFIKYMNDPNIIDNNHKFEDIAILDVDISMLEKITLSDLFQFLNYTINVRKNDASARARKISSLKSFFKYLNNKAMLIKNDPTVELEFPKLKKTLPKYLTLDQSVSLLDSVEGKSKERDYCILTLFLNCGLRLSELVALNINDIRSDNTVKVTGKGNKERIIYLNDACVKSINNYLKVRPDEKLIAKEDKNALFISRLNKRMGRQAVQLMVKKYINKSNIKTEGISVHKLRHTAATLLYQYGNVDIRILKEILGHENLGTTEIYTHIANKELKKAAESSPLSGLTGKNNV